MMALFEVVKVRFKNGGHTGHIAKQWVDPNLHELVDDTDYAVPAPPVDDAVPVDDEPAVPVDDEYIDEPADES
jgi:hypothetical protein